MSHSEPENKPLPASAVFLHYSLPPKPEGHKARESIYQIIEEIVAETGCEPNEIDNMEIERRQRERHNGYADQLNTISSYKSQYTKAKKAIDDPVVVIKTVTTTTKGAPQLDVYQIAQITKKLDRLIESATAKWGIDKKQLKQIFEALMTDDD